jgi:hypothetical protein
MRSPFDEFHLREHIDIDRPAAVVWPYLIAFEQIPTWEEGVVSVRQLTAGEPALGTRITADRMYGRVQETVEGEITAFEPGRAATMTIRGGPIRFSEATYAVDPLDGERARVTFTIRASMRGPMRVLHPLLPAIGRRGVRRNLLRLRQRVHAGLDPRST